MAQYPLFITKDDREKSSISIETTKKYKTIKINTKPEPWKKPNFQVH